ncbi:CIC11C00000001154 [Sungouiella intermedia]|uniref:CIC11C00000001154 n=1 Tax=Sungouiella intermedia TaxID=45354 RepID=A0A1L0DV49_9ASCO|nr:CIC11C00000001154 [[Candida] intermedia]
MINDSINMLRIRAIGEAFKTSTSFQGSFNHAVALRFYSTPQFKKSGNIVVNALNYVREVDDFQDKIAKETPEATMAAKLIGSIDKNPELLSLLLLFHYELSKFDITPHSSRNMGQLATLRFKMAMIWKLSRIHNVFWEQCRLEDVAERNHRLAFLVQDVGILDPKYYEEHYQELQSGVFRGTDFRHVEILGPSRF